MRLATKEDLEPIYRCFKGYPASSRCPATTRCPTSSRLLSHNVERQFGGFSVSGIHRCPQTSHSATPMRLVTAKEDKRFCTCGTRSTPEASAQPACTSELKRSASLAADGRCTRTGMQRKSTLSHAATGGLP